MKTDRKNEKKIKKLTKSEKNKKGKGDGKKHKKNAGGKNRKRSARKRAILSKHSHSKSGSFHAKEEDGRSGPGNEEDVSGQRVPPKRRLRGKSNGSKSEEPNNTTKKQKVEDSEKVPSPKAKAKAKAKASSSSKTSSASPKANARPKAKAKAKAKAGAARGRKKVPEEDPFESKLYSKTCHETLLRFVQKFVGNENHLGPNFKNTLKSMIAGDALASLNIYWSRMGCGVKHGDHDIHHFTFGTFDVSPSHKCALVVKCGEIAVT